MVWSGLEVWQGLAKALVANIKSHGKEAFGGFWPDREPSELILHLCTEKRRLRLLELGEHSDAYAE